jgi:hypothetical protein
VEDGRGVDRIREWVDLEGISIYFQCGIVRNVLNFSPIMCE